jgi:dihydroorotase
MKVILQSVTVIDPTSAHHLKVVDIFVQDNLIKEIGKKLSVAGAKTLDCKGQYVSIGWIDLHVNFCDPGFETKEDIHSGLNAAAKGGFVGVALMPNTQPALKSKSEIEYINNKSNSHAVTIYPIGCLSANREGKDLAEMYDMKLAGAKAFSDGNAAVQDAGLMSRAMLYAKGIDSLIISKPEDKNIAQNAQMNEGQMSTLLGMKGNPSLAEELMVSRDIFLAEYQDAKVHFTCISSAKSVELIKTAKKKGLKVTADVSVNHLYFDDTMLETFDTNFKLSPPLRTKEDIKALKQGLKEGTIDAICSQHTPEDIEHKQVEFEYAKEGMIGLQTAFSLALMTLEKQMDLSDIIAKFTIAPRAILGLPVQSIAVNQVASLTLFDPNATWKFQSSENVSRSKNSALFNQALKGKVISIINNNQLK